jgi:hypothetical protein
MSDTIIQLPSTSQNTGPLVRVNQRVIGGQNVNEHFNIITDQVTLFSGIINQLAPALSTTYTSSTLRMNIDGYDVVNFICKSSGTGTTAVILRIYGSHDGATWFNAATHEFMVLSPQAGAMLEGFVEWRTPFNYVRCTVSTDAILAPSVSIVVDALVGTKFSGGFTPHGVAINYYGSILEGAHDIRGAYVLQFNGAGVATINYDYLSLFNPANSIINLRIDSVFLQMMYISSSGSLSARPLILSTTTAQSGGNNQIPRKLNNTYATSLAIGATGNPTVTLDTQIMGVLNTNLNSSGPSSVKFESSVGNPYNYDQLSLSPGTGITIYSPVALTISDYIIATIVFSEAI